MSASTWRLRHTRKRINCTECGLPILARGTYLHAVCPPWNDANPGKKWWVIKACLRCTERHGLHNSDTRKQLEDGFDALPATSPISTKDGGR